MVTDVIGALREWQDDASPFQLHPGDLGWFWRHGPEAMAAAVRSWRRDGDVVAVGLLDGPDVLRMTVAPDRWRDEELARQVIGDLPPGTLAVESPDGTLVQELLTEAGWKAGEPWTPLRHDLTELPSTGLRTEVVEPGRESEFTAVHRSAWGSERFTDEVWRTMAAGLPYADARCLLGRDEDGVAVAGVTVWSAGPGRPGLVEPMGVHADHRRRGHGVAICVAAAAELKKMGSSGAMVCTPSSLTSAVSTYRSAGYRELPQRLDRSRAS